MTNPFPSWKPSKEVGRETSASQETPRGGFSCMAKQGRKCRDAQPSGSNTVLTETHAVPRSSSYQKSFLCARISCCDFKPELPGCWKVIGSTITAQITWKQQLWASVIANKHHQRHHPMRYWVSTSTLPNSCCAIATREVSVAMQNPDRSLDSLHCCTEDNKLNLPKNSSNCLIKKKKKKKPSRALGNNL